MFTRLMRDKGFNFYTTDKYCPNIFAEFNDLKELKQETRFELTTAFEVFEHLASPVDEIGKMMKYSDNLIFSTEIVPSGVISDQNDWWYFCPEMGQHISFFSLSALQYIADMRSEYFYTNGISLHLFSKKKLSENPFIANTKEPFLIRKFRKYISKYDQRNMIHKQSLIEQDWNEAKSRISF